jgi:hypothetical protein
MRVFMLSYAAQLQPFRSPEVFEQMADALNGDPEKAAGCDVSAEVKRRGIILGTPGASLFAQPAISVLDVDANTFFVDAVAGSDANSGNLSEPFQSIERALQATRATPGSNSTIVLRAGTFYQNATIVLTTADSGLTIRAFPGEEVNGLPHRAIVDLLPVSHVLGTLGLLLRCRCGLAAPSQSTCRGSPTM